jgi:hypothetical protein
MKGFSPLHRSRNSQAVDDGSEASEKSLSATPPAEGLRMPQRNPFAPEIPNLRPSDADMATGLDLYFKFCHRQPIWCFERDQVSDFNAIPEELACSILALTSRFADKPDHLQLYGNNSKTLIMLRIANGTVDLTTMESLCLLSYSSFIGK